MDIVKLIFKSFLLLTMFFASMSITAQIQVYPYEQLEGVEDRLGSSGQVIRAGRIYELAFSPESQFLFSAGNTNDIRIFELESKEEVQRFLIDSGSVSSITISEDGRFTLASGSNDEWYWEVETAQEISSPYNFDYGAHSSAIFPDGETAISVGNLPNAKIWALSTGENIGQLVGHTDSIYSVQISSDGRFALTGSSDTTIRLWNTETSQEIQQYSFPDEVYSVDFSPNEEFILASGKGGNLITYNTESGEQHKQIQTDALNIWTAEYMLNGQYIIAEERTADTSTIRIRDTETGIVLVELLGNSGKLYALAVSPDETLVAAGGEDNVIFMWEVSTNLHALRTAALYILETQRRTFYDSLTR